MCHFWRIFWLVVHDYQLMEYLQHSELSLKLFSNFTHCWLVVLKLRSFSVYVVASAAARNVKLFVAKPHQSMTHIYATPALQHFTSK